MNKGETRGAARRAWLSGLLIWSFVLQLLLPVLGPVRLGDGAATAALGRFIPICTLEGLRLAEPAADGGGAGPLLAIDAGSHCILCVLPATGAPSAASVPAPTVAWRFAWAAAEPDRPIGERRRSPQSARGPPGHS